MKFLVHAILQTTFLGASALQASSPAAGEPNQNAPLHRSKEHRTSAVVLDSAGEAALERTVDDLPLSLAAFNGSAELATAESHPVFSTRKASHSSTPPSQEAAVLHKRAASVRTPLTLTQLLTAGGKSALSKLEQLRSHSRNALGEVDALGIMLPILLCFFPAALILAAIITPSWFRVSTQPTAPAGAALLEKPAAVSPGPKRAQPQGDPSDMGWRSRVAQESAVFAPEPVIEIEEEGRDPFATSTVIQGVANWFGDFGTPVSMAFPAKQAPQLPPEADILCPEMVVREATGAQFMLDGLFEAHEQNTFAEVRRNNSDMRETEVMNAILCEGALEGGILLEWPVGRNPIAFINTSNAVSPRGHAKPSKRYITIIPCFNQPFQKTTPPFAIMQADRQGFAMKRYGNEKVLLRIIAGGHNTDYANVVDPSGRLMATMTLRGQSVKNRRVITMCQGMDAVLVISAVIAATKLS